jgi:hypothetical protein
MRRRPVSNTILASIGMLALVCLGGDAFAEEPAAAPIRFSEHLISNDYTYPYGIAAADIDGDGDLDLTSADALPHNMLYWFENDGRGEFKQHIIQRDDPERLERHAVADIDGDGDLDVVIVENLFGDLKWFENDGRPADEDLWKLHYITYRTLPGAYDVVAVDLDGDKDLDVAASSWRLSNKFTWYENDGTPADGHWQERDIETDLSETRTIRVADFDGDGDPDLLGTASGAGLVMWYENSGRPARDGWKRHTIDKALRPVHGDAADMDVDGDLDVVMCLGMGPPLQDDVKNAAQQVVWYENVGRRGEEAWPKHVIQDGLPQSFEAVSGDLDGDGDLEVVATAWADTARVLWYDHAGDPRGAWTPHLLKDKWINANMPILADLNGDGRLDIAATAERGSLEFRWWRNEGHPAKE